jgi:actinorhodin biosynthesis protein ActVIA
MTGAELHFEVQQFYARQMQCLDSGDAVGFADTFADDAVFVHVPGEVVRGRARIAAEIARNVERVQQAKAVRRHWFGMLVFEAESDDLIRTRYAAITSSTSMDGTASLGASSLVEDVLVRRDGRLWTTSRTVHSDGAPR